MWLQAADPKSDGAARDWVAIYDECSKILYEVWSLLKQRKTWPTARTPVKGSIACHCS